MTAYGFKKQFVEPMRAGTKIGTIRRLGNRPHVKPGGLIQFYCGMRTKSCFRIMPDRPCLRVNEIRINLTGKGHVLTSNGVHIEGFSECDAFARMDGFRDMAEMLDFWENTHGAIDFSGVHIIWAQLLEQPSPTGSPSTPSTTYRS